MLQFRDITAAAKSAIRADATLEAWSQLKFGKSVKIYVGLDAANPPKESDCPFVALVAPGRKAGVEANDSTYELVVTFGLVCPDITSDVTGDETMEGCGLIGDLWELIWTALVTGFSQNVFLSVEDTTIDGVVTFPLFIGASSININVPAIIGAEISL
jgi:hypothetical protein